MLIAHVPAGYLLIHRLAVGWRGLLSASLAASVLPDVDLLWFYFVNARQNVHHDFVFHWPLFWLALGALGWGLCRVMAWRRAIPFLGAALLALMLHMALDSVAAEIAWLAPFSDRTWGLVEVPARHDWWVWSFILHWTFALELTITACAGFVAWRSLRRQGKSGAIVRNAVRP